MLELALAVGPPAESLPLMASFLIVAVASAIRAPSFGEHGVSLAPPALLAILAVNQPTGWSLLGVGGWVIGAHLLVPSLRRSRSAALSARASGLSCFLLLGLWMVINASSVRTSANGDFPRVVSLLGVVIVWATVDGIARLLVQRRVNRRIRLLGSVFADLPIAVLASGSAVVGSVLWVHAGVWAAAVGVLPYAVTHRLLSTLAASRREQALALRAIGRLPEAAGLSNCHHSEAVERLAFELGKRSGLRGRELSVLSQAALLHDIGLLCTTKAEAKNQGYSAGDVARWGAEILQTSPGLFRVARLIDGQADPFRTPGSAPNPSLDIRSQILNIACEVERLRDAGMEHTQVVDCIFGESAFRFSPDLVGAVVPAVEAAERASDMEIRSM